jgi:hypothetical protein
MIQQRCKHMLYTILVHCLTEGKIESRLTTRATSFKMFLPASICFTRSESPGSLLLRTASRFSFVERMA